MANLDLDALAREISWILQKRLGVSPCSIAQKTTVDELINIFVQRGKEHKRWIAYLVPTIWPQASLVFVLEGEPPPPEAIRALWLDKPPE